MVPVIVPVDVVIFIAAVVGYALYLVTVLVVAGDADLGLLQLVLDVGAGSEYHLAAADQALGHVVHVLYSVGVHAEAKASQAGDGYRVTLRHPGLDYLADGVPRTFQCTALDAAADRCLADYLALLQLAVGLGAHHVEQLACVRLAELHQCLLCFNVYHNWGPSP